MLPWENMGRSTQNLKSLEPKDIRGKRAAGERGPEALGWGIAHQQCQARLQLRRRHVLAAPLVVRPAHINIYIYGVGR